MKDDLKVTHFNESKINSRMTGIKRYEDELYNHLSEHINITRIMRGTSRYKDNMVASWLFRYKTNTDLVHATSQTIAPVVYFRKFKRFIVTVHDVIPLFYPQTINDISKRIQWQLIPRALHKVDRIIAVSNYVKEHDLVEVIGIPEDKITVIYGGIDHDRFKPMDRDECKLCFNLDRNKKHILSIMSTFDIKGFEPYKRQDVANKVINQVYRCRDDVAVTYLGEKYIPDHLLPLFYNCFDVLLYPSEYTTFEFPVLEAMACGVPVVCLNTGSNPEIVGNSGGLVDDIDDIDQFVEATLKLLDKPKPDSKCVEQVRKFSWDKTAKQTLKLYEEML